MTGLLRIGKRDPDPELKFGIRIQHKGEVVAVGRWDEQTEIMGRVV